MIWDIFYAAAVMVYINESQVSNALTLTVWIQEGGGLFTLVVMIWVEA